MNNVRKTLPVLFLLALSACGGTGGGGSGTSAPVVTDETSAPDTSVAPADSTPESTFNGVTIEVTVGVDDDPGRVERIALGSSVTLEITNPYEDDEFHLHGYDLSTGDTEADETATIAFTADVAGTFEVESHVTDDVLVTLVVE
ncbi:MAG: hypothetical protein ACKOFF_04875 [Acidimicrobiales bacterium]